MKFFRSGAIAAAASIASGSAAYAAAGTPDDAAWIIAVLTFAFGALAAFADGSILE